MENPPPPCPFCGSADAIAVSRERLIPGKPVYKTELAYLCGLGHMFTRSEAIKMEAEKSLRPAG